MSAFRGIKVLDLSRVLAAPYSTQMLSDFGATVWKIEALHGDDTRNWGNHYFSAGNRGKQSVAVNLKDPRGQDIVKRLAQEADVLVENYKVGDLARYGLAYEDLRKLKEQLIYVSVTGFGQTGPRKDQLGYDTVVQAMTGIMSVTGEPDRPPAKVGIAWVDVLSGLTATIGIITALYERQKSGKGQYIDVSLFDVGMMALVDAGQDFLLNGRCQQRTGSIHRSFAPAEPFLAADGWLTMAVGNNEQFERLCGVLGLSALIDDPRYADNALRLQHREALAGSLAAVIKTRSRAHWVNACTVARVPLSPVLDIAEALHDPQTVARGIVWQVERPHGPPMPMLANPLQHMSGTPAKPHGVPPAAGEHSVEILSQVLRMTDADIAALVRDNVIGVA